MVNDDFLIKEGDPLTIGNCHSNNKFRDKNGSVWGVVPSFLRVRDEYVRIFEWRILAPGEGPW